MVQELCKLLSRGGYWLDPISFVDSFPCRCQLKQVCRVAHSPQTWPRPYFDIPAMLFQNPFASLVRFPAAISLTMSGIQNFTSAHFPSTSSLGYHLLYDSSHPRVTMQYINREQQIILVLSVIQCKTQTTYCFSFSSMVIVAALFS